MGLSCYVVSSQIGGKENQGARGLANIIMLCSIINATTKKSKKIIMLCSTVSIIGLLGMGSSILGSVLGITGGIVGLSSGYRKSD
ncbi:MAG TPA: hypothetical protein VE130_05540 [Nitrososphaeraceae archaeon]|nr:hypothetical protein [Nitrososphaeraceae archaeon]